MPPHDALSFNAALVLHALHSGHHYGFDVMQATDLPSGTVYPILRRLEGKDLVSSSWEEAERAHADARPPRRYYRLSPAGVEALAEARARIAAQSAFLGLAEGNGE